MVNQGPPPCTRVTNPDQAYATRHRPSYTSYKFDLGCRCVSKLSDIFAPPPLTKMTGSVGHLTWGNAVFPPPLEGLESSSSVEVPLRSVSVQAGGFPTHRPAPPLSLRDTSPSSSSRAHARFGPAGAAPGGRTDLASLPWGGGTAVCRVRAEALRPGWRPVCGRRVAGRPSAGRWVAPASLRWVVAAVGRLRAADRLRRMT